jgi:hypothetical protein
MASGFAELFTPAIRAGKENTEKVLQRVTDVTATDSRILGLDSGGKQWANHCE